MGKPAGRSGRLLHHPGVEAPNLHRGNHLYNPLKNGCRGAESGADFPGLGRGVAVTMRNVEEELIP